MITTWLVAALHLSALGIGLGSVWARGRALGSTLDPAGLRRVFAADNWWGVAGLLWIGTGLGRLFGSLDKGTSYYLANHLFWGKMGLLVVLLLLEISVGVTLVRWRSQLRRGEPVAVGAAARLATISRIQAVLVLAMVLAATGMARGHGMR